MGIRKDHTRIECKRRKENLGQLIKLLEPAMLHNNTYGQN